MTTPTRQGTPLDTAVGVDIPYAHTAQALANKFKEGFHA